MKNNIQIAIISLFIATIPVSAHAELTQNLKYGSKGDQVIELQEFLVDKGFLTVVTGNFYSLTRKAVIAYQTSVNLPNTGFVGVLTRGIINSELAYTPTEEETNLGVATTTPIQDLQNQVKDLQAEIKQITPKQIIMPPKIDLSDLYIKKLNKPHNDSLDLYLEVDAKDQDGKVIDKPTIHFVLTFNGNKINESDSQGFISQTPQDPHSAKYSYTLLEKGTYTLTYSYGNITKTETIIVE